MHELASSHFDQKGQGSKRHATSKYKIIGNLFDQKFLALSQISSLRPQPRFLQALRVEESSAGGGVAADYFPLVGPAQLAGVGAPRAVPAAPVHAALLGGGRLPLLAAARNLQALEVEGLLADATALHLWRRVHQ